MTPKDGKLKKVKASFIFVSMVILQDKELGVVQLATYPTEF